VYKTALDFEKFFTFDTKIEIKRPRMLSDSCAHIVVHIRVFSQKWDSEMFEQLK